MNRDTRGVSEVIGFVLVFSLVIGTISIVYVAGMSGLDDTRNAERINNAERAFDVMANNFEQMGRGDAPNRATEIKLADAQLRTTGGRRVSVNTTNMDQAVAANPVSIRYDTRGDTNLVYENGAVIRVDDGIPHMLREPDFLFKNNKIVMRFISLRGSDQGVGGSASTALVRAERLDRQVLANRGASDNVTIKMQTPSNHADEWEEYYESEIESIKGSADYCSQATVNEDLVEVTCSGFSVDELVVASVRVRVSLT